MIKSLIGVSMISMTGSIVKSTESFGKQRKVRKCSAIPLLGQIVSHNDLGGPQGRKRVAL
jgi:hypothetical protein